MQRSGFSGQPSAVSRQVSGKPMWSGYSYPLHLILFSLLIAVSPARMRAQEKPVALKGGKLLTVTHGTIENGVIVMQGGKITAIGAAGSVNVPGDANIIDTTGMTIYPGLIDSETNLGLTEISAENMTNDLVELSDEIMPHMHTAEAFHAESALIPVARMNGITNAVVAPEGADTLPGQDSDRKSTRLNSSHSLHDALPISHRRGVPRGVGPDPGSPYERYHQCRRRSRRCRHAPRPGFFHSTCRSLRHRDAPDPR